jgi:hypothetical protein
VKTSPRSAACKSPIAAVQHEERTEPVDRIVRRSTRDDSFSVFCFSGSRLISVESVNHRSEHMEAKRILERGIALKREQAADANFDLDALARQAPKGATVDHGKL